MIRSGMAALSALLLVGGCDAEAPTVVPSGPTFVVSVVGEEFRVRVTSDAMAATLRTHMASGREGVLFGALRAGNGGFNTAHAWHLDPGTVATPDVAIEVCDGRPSDIDGDLSYWMTTVKAYCPWGARVVREEP